MQREESAEEDSSSKPKKNPSRKISTQFSVKVQETEKELPNAFNSRNQSISHPNNNRKTLDLPEIRLSAKASFKVPTPQTFVQRLEQ